MRSSPAPSRTRAGWRVAVCATERTVGVEALHALELALVDGASARRRAEFATGRSCARGALAELEPALAGHPVPADERGVPQWPPGVVGSITHCAGWTGAVVARRRTRMGLRGIAGVGIDAEPVRPLPTGVLDVAASDLERTHLALLSRRDPDVPWDTVLFSAKEAAYKAAYPLLGLVLGHGAVAVRLSGDRRFAASVGAGAAPVTVRGRWLAGPAVVVTLGVAL